jgi:ectoine hydroxylase-related dioxygenase (phytanoyl-CoA dioxygenase family)
MIVLCKDLIDLSIPKGNGKRLNHGMHNSKQPLSEGQIEEFFREGYIVVENLIDPKKIDRIMEEAVKVPVDARGIWTPKAFEHDNPTQDAKLHQLLVDESLVGAVEQIFEAPARADFGMLAIVSANGGKGLPWHQDGMYGQILGRALNSFVALCDITPDKAILWVAPGTHLLGIQPSEQAAHGHHQGKEPANGRPLPLLRKGSVCMFDRNTMHHSKTNETSEHRYAYAAQFREDKARDGNGKKDPRKMLVSELRQTWTGLLD